MAEENLDTQDQTADAPAEPKTGEGDYNVEEMAETLGEDLFPGEEKEGTEGDGEEGDDTSETDEGEKKGEEKSPTDEGDKKDSKSEESPTVAPKTWRTEAIGEWDKLPPVVKAEIIKREEDFHRGIEGYRFDADIGRKMQEIYMPYGELLNAHNVDPYQLAKGLLDTHVRMSLTSTPLEVKERMLLKMAQDYGVDLAKIDPQYQHEEDPTVKALRSELDGIKSKLTQREQEEQNQIRASISTEIDNFAKNPENIYFDDVAQDMVMLLRGGAKSLKDAYDKAVLMNPVVREKERARIEEEARAKSEAERQKKVAEAKKKTEGNVRISTSKGNARQQKALDDLDATLSEAFDKIQNS